MFDPGRSLRTSPALAIAPSTSSNESRLISTFGYRSLYSLPVGLTSPGRIAATMRKSAVRSASVAVRNRCAVHCAAAQKSQIPHAFCPSARSPKLGAVYAKIARRVLYGQSTQAATFIRRATTKRTAPATSLCVRDEHAVGAQLDDVVIAKRHPKTFPSCHRGFANGECRHETRRWPRAQKNTTLVLDSGHNLSPSRESK
jgi:hypothetical protein